MAAKLRSSDISIEIIQFYPDTLMNLECLILFKYDRTSKLIQFENFFELKATKFEFVHKSHNKDAIVDFKIYGGGDRKIYIGGGNIIIKNSLFNHYTMKQYERNYTCILTQAGKEFLFPCKRPENDNASIRLEILIKNNNFLKEAISDTLGKMIIINELENDEVNIKNDSQISVESKKLNFNKKENDWKSMEIEIDEKQKTYFSNILNLSPINKKVDFNTNNFEKLSTLGNDNFDEINDDIKADLLYKDNSHFDSFFERPELYYRSDYPQKKDLSETKSKQDQKNVLIHDLFAFKDLYYEKFNRMKEYTAKLRSLHSNYKFQLYKMKLKYKKLSLMREIVTDKHKKLNIVNFTHSSLTTKQREINSSLFDFFKKTFKIKYNKIDIMKNIQSKYKEKDIKDVLVKVMARCSVSSLKLLTKERLASLIEINKKIEFFKLNELLEIMHPQTFKMDNSISEERLNQEEFDLLYKNKRPMHMNLFDKGNKRKSTIRKSVLYTNSKNNSIVLPGNNNNNNNMNSTFTDLVNHTRSNIRDIALAVSSKGGLVNVNSTKMEFTELGESTEDNDLADYLDEWLCINPEYKPVELIKLNDNFYKIKEEKFVLEKNEQTDDYYAITSKGKIDFSDFLKKHAKKVYKNMNKIVIDEKIIEMRTKLLTEKKLLFNNSISSNDNIKTDKANSSVNREIGNIRKNKKESNFSFKNTNKY